MCEVVLRADVNGGTVPEQADAITTLPNATERVRATVLHVFGDDPSGISATRILSVRHAVDRLKAADAEVTVAEGSGDSTGAVRRAAEQVNANPVRPGERRRSPARGDCSSVSLRRSPSAVACQYWSLVRPIRSTTNTGGSTAEGRGWFGNDRRPATSHSRELLGIPFRER